MSSLIEQAAERLAQIREAGIAVPEISPAMELGARASAPAGASAGDPKVVDADIAHGSSSKVIELDLDVLASQGYLVPNAPRSHMADQFRVIKRPLKIGRASCRERVCYAV